MPPRISVLTGSDTVLTLQPIGKTVENWKARDSGFYLPPDANQNKELTAKSSILDGRSLFLSEPLNGPVDVIEDIGFEAQF